MRISVCFLVMPTMATAFLSSNLFTTPEPEVRADLKHLTDMQADHKLKIRLDIGHEGDSHLIITGLILELHHDLADYDHAQLPGADGNFPKISSGHRRLDLLSDGHFINMLGTQHVKMLKPCWEINWRKDKPAGTLICGFELRQTYKRNDATLPEGNLYFSFPVWTQGGLLIGQAQLKKQAEQGQRYLEGRDKHLDEFESTNNLFMKFVHLRNAFDAAFKYSDLPRDTLDSIPDFDKVTKLQDDLFLTTTGLVWQTVGPLEEQKHRYLGHAHILSDDESKTRLMP